MIDTTELHFFIDDDCVEGGYTAQDSHGEMHLVPWDSLPEEAQELFGRMMYLPVEARKELVAKMRTENVPSHKGEYIIEEDGHMVFRIDDEEDTQLELILYEEIPDGTKKH